MHREEVKIVPSNNSKYSQEMRDKTVKYIFESGKSATSVAEELGIDVNTVCRWVRDYRRAHQMPSYAEEKEIKLESKAVSKEEKSKIKEQEKEINRLKKLYIEEREKVEILKKSLHNFMEPRG